MEKTYILAISDLHLGSSNCDTELMLQILQTFDFEWLIIVGDLYNKGEQIPNDQFEVVAFLRQYREKIVYVDGNHDASERRLLDTLLGIRAVKRHTFKIGKKKFCAIHGHQFDRFLFIFNELWIDAIIEKILWLLKKEETYIAKWIDKSHQNHAKHVAKRALRYARRRKINAIICGHTHLAEHSRSLNRKRTKEIEYINLGCFPYSFATIDQQGAITLHNST